MTTPEQWGQRPSTPPPGGYGQPPPAPWGQPPSGGQYPPPMPPPYCGPPQAMNGMTIASMVLGILWVYWIGSILALVFGYVA